MKELPVRFNGATFCCAVLCISVAGGAEGRSAEAGTPLEATFTYATSFVGTQTQGSVTTPFSQTSSETVTLTPNATFGNRHDLVRERTVYASPGSDIADEFIGFSRVGTVIAERAYGFRFEQQVGMKTTRVVTYVPAGFLLDEFPERAGLSWYPNADSRSFGETTSTGQPGRATSDNRSAAGGAYVTTYAEHLGSGSTAYDSLTKLELRPDGSAAVSEAATGINNELTTFGLPKRQGGVGVIPVTTSGGNAKPAAPTPKNLVEVPDWFPGHVGAPRPLSTARDENRGRVVTPAGCGIQAGKTAYDIRGTLDEVEPLEGYVESEVSDQFETPDTGIICTIVKTNYTGYDNLRTGAPTITDVETSTAILTSSSGLPKAHALAAGSAPMPKLDLVTPMRMFHDRAAHRMLHGLRGRPSFPE